MKPQVKKIKRIIFAVGLLTAAGVLLAQDPDKKPSSYLPVVIPEPFAAVMARMKAAKPELARKHLALLEERYDLSNQPANGVTMSRSKPIQEGVRAKLSSGMTWPR